MASSVLVISDAQFEAEVLRSESPVLAYFWASWCGPCRLMSPVMEKVAQEYGDRLKVVKLEVDPNPETVATYKVEGVPSMLLFRNGALVEQVEGAISKQKLEDFLNNHLSAV
ncbi:MAG: thioredoxin [Synechococcales cyanobacterium T60_A2020_003]|nr:thioredoxin [Synechococcales cyanobacterium T60_A2020_003]